MNFKEQRGKNRTNPRGRLPLGQRPMAAHLYSRHTHGILTTYSNLVTSLIRRAKKRQQGDNKETSKRHHGAGMVGRRGASVRRVGSDGARPGAGSRAGWVGRREAGRGERGAGRRRRDGFGRGGAQAARSVRIRGRGAGWLRAWRGGGRRVRGRGGGGQRKRRGGRRIRAGGGRRKESGAGAAAA